MKVRTQELTDAALDWAVGECLGYELSLYGVDPSIRARKPGLGVYAPFKPSYYWNQGGPIIEEAFIAVFSVETRPFEGEWAACVFRHQQEGTLDDMGGSGYAFYASELSRGPTPLIAAMRCFVTARLGNEVDIPKELMK